MLSVKNKNGVMHWKNKMGFNTRLHPNGKIKKHKWAIVFSSFYFARKISLRTYWRIIFPTKGKKTGVIVYQSDSALKIN